MKRGDEAQLQVLAYWALRALRSFMEPCEILEALSSQGVRVSRVDLSRYLSGTVLPRPSRASEILRALVGARVLSTVLSRVARVDERGVVNASRLAFDRDVLTLASATLYVVFREAGITKILTAAVNGVPLASLAAFVTGAGLCVAKQTPDAYTTQHLEVMYFAPDPPRYVTLYLPKSALGPRDKVLIVDDVLQSGRTLRALVELTRTAGAKVVGAFSLVAVGDEWLRVASEEGVRVAVGYVVGGRA